MVSLCLKMRRVAGGARAARFGPAPHFRGQAKGKSMKEWITVLKAADAAAW
jgi:hypothetical protein